MAWTSPMTAVAFEPFTAAEFNTHVRDNLLETAPAKAGSAGGLIVTDGANSITQRTPNNAVVDIAEESSSTSFTDLATAGPEVTVTTGESALVIMTCAIRHLDGVFSSYMSYAVSGSTVISADDSPGTLKHQDEIAHREMSASAVFYQTGLTAGVNTFTAKYRVSDGSGRWDNRHLIVIPF